MIPKIIHQTWKNNIIPEEYISYQQKVKDLHPGWEYRLWTDEDNLELVRNHYPDFLKIYTELPKNIMRADAIRYLIMDHIGGVYLDLDYEMFKPFDLLDYDLVLPLNRSTDFGDSYDSYGNCIFGSSPGYAFWKYAIDDLMVPRDYEAYFKTLKNKPYVLRNTKLEEAITGPAFLTRIFLEKKDSLSDYLLPPREMFHPVNSDRNRENIKLLTEGKTYGIHHCVGTWRNKSIPKKVLHKIKTILKS